MSSRHSLKQFESEEDKRMGPRMEACGTPQEILAGGEEKWHMLTEDVLLAR